MQHDPTKQKIIELVPELSKPWESYDEQGNFHEDERPITLADVLRAIDKVRIDVSVSSFGGFEIWSKEGLANNIFVLENSPKWKWNLTTDYDGQTQKVKEFIGKLLGV